MLFKKRYTNNGIRNILIGIRPRIILGFSLIFLLSIGLLLVITYFYQYNILFQEKTKSVANLSKVVGSVSEILLEKDLTESKLTIESKKKFVEANIENFITLNDDVMQVILTDRNGRIILSKGEKVISARFLNKLIRNKNTTLTIFKTNIAKNITNIYECKTIVFPILQMSGLLVSINQDFDKVYKKLYESGASAKDREKLYDSILEKYSGFLNINSKKKKDIDYLFLDLYRYLKFNNTLIVPKDQSYLFSPDWLENEKKKIDKGLVEGNLTLVKNSYERIFKNFSKIREIGENSRFIGFNVVVFNVTSLVEEIKGSLKVTIIVFAIIYILSTVLIYFVSKIYVDNLKKLEKWGIEVSNGNLSAKVEISSNDEIGRLADVFNNMLKEIVSKYHLEKFVSKSTVSLVKSKKSLEMKLGKVSRKNLAFLFSDVRGFTSFSEKNDPELVVEVLNTYLDIQSKVVKKYRGDIDDFVGDQIMAHFSGIKRADTAIKVAIEIMETISRLNSKREENNLPTFKVGIGIHIGDVVIGNIGSEFRMDFACIGDVVNTCSRLCSVAGPMEIIASKEIVEASSKNFKYQEITPIILKGKEKPFEVYKILY